MAKNQILFRLFKFYIDSRLQCTPDNNNDPWVSNYLLERRDFNNIESSGKRTWRNLLSTENRSEQ